MDSGYYAAMTGLVARNQALDTAAANLANAQTPGYRAEREYFRSVLLGPDASDSQLGRTVNNYGLLGGDQLSMKQGPLQTRKPSSQPRVPPAHRQAVLRSLLWRPACLSPASSTPSLALMWLPASREFERLRQRLPPGAVSKRIASLRAVTPRLVLKGSVTGAPSRRLKRDFARSMNCATLYESLCDSPVKWVDGAIFPSSSSPALASHRFRTRRRSEFDRGRRIVSFSARIVRQGFRCGRGRCNPAGYQYRGALARTIDIPGGISKTTPLLWMEAAPAEPRLGIRRMAGRHIAATHRQQDVSRYVAVAVALRRDHVRAQLSVGTMVAEPVRRTSLPHLAHSRDGCGECLRGLLRRRGRISRHGALRHLRRSRHTRNECIEGAHGRSLHRYSSTHLRSRPSGGVAFLP